MPEGDTIFRAATALRKALQGARVTQFHSARLGRGPVGERIEEVTARGKNLLLRFEKGRTLRTHMMMHGSWHIYREGERWRLPGFQARVELHADNGLVAVCFAAPGTRDRKSTRLNSSHGYISYAVFCLKKKKKHTTQLETRSRL